MKIDTKHHRLHSKCGRNTNYLVWDIFTESIHFIKIPSDVWVKKGQFARFECAATGRSTPTISWSKDDADDFPAAQERRMHKMSDSDEFFIMDVTVNDAGVYTCTATNADGSISTDVNLFVSCKYYLYWISVLTSYETIALNIMN